MVFKLYNPQYEIQPYALFSIIFAVFLDRIIKKYPQIVILLSIALLIISSIVLVKSINKERTLHLSSNVALNNLIISVSSPKDYIINNNNVGGIRLYATGYYWFDFFVAPHIHQHLFPRRELPNLNLIIKTKKPKIVPKDTYWVKCLDDSFKPSRQCSVTDKVEAASVNDDYGERSFIYIRKY
ncbi:MAG: hypothetical protein IJZ30_05910 [Alphaproteobacteria bacterium]|nr:hypothetical protein [Alphaproteobacteria bacterium]